MSQDALQLLVDASPPEPPRARRSFALWCGLVWLALSAWAPAATLEMAFRHVFAGTPLLLDSLRYENAAAETLSIERLSYLLSGFALEGADGKWAELEGQFAWIDAAQQRVLLRLENVPTGSYRGVRFSIGPDAKTNAGDPFKYPAGHALNANLNGLHWSWQGGYIFLALEGHWRQKDGTLAGYSYHLARDPSRTQIHLAVPIEAGPRSTQLLVDFDLAALLNAPRPLSLSRDGVSTHSREADPVAAALMANLKAAFSVRSLSAIDPSAPPLPPVKPLYLPAKFTPYRFQMSAAFPIPDLPRDNPLIEERVALGKALFNEPLLSKDGSLSCASCHVEAAAFSDARPVSVGVRGQAGTRNAMPLFNLAWKKRFFWDGRAASLREQALMPIVDHSEMDESLARVEAKLATREGYPKLFGAAFGADEITGEKIGLAIEQYLLTLVSFDSRFDRAMRGAVTLSEEEQHGFELFMTEYEPRTGHTGADCFHCHGGPLFSDAQFHNNGLPFAKAGDLGRYTITHSEADRGRFSTPSLRNISLTAPYMHDGRFATLEEVLRHYTEGVENSPTLDPNLAKHPKGGVPLSAEEQRAIVAFLRTL